MTILILRIFRKSLVEHADVRVAVFLLYPNTWWVWLFGRNFILPSDKHGRWHNLRSFACNLRARHGGAMGNISGPVEVWIQAQQFLLCRTLGRNITSTCCLCQVQLFLARHALSELILVSEAQNSLLGVLHLCLLSFTSRTPRVISRAHSSPPSKKACTRVTQRLPWSVN